MTETLNGPPAATITDSILAAIVTISADAIICVDEQQVIIFFNDGAREIFGYAPEEIMGKPLEVLIPQRFRATHAAHVERFGRSDVHARRMGERGQILGLRKNGVEFPAEAAISHLGSEGNPVYSVVLRDVTERRRAHETQRFLAEAGEALASSLGPEDTLRNVTRLVVPHLADACVVNVYRGGRFHGAAVAHVDPERAIALERIRTEHPIDPSSNHPVARVIRTLAPLIIAGSEGTTTASGDIDDEPNDIFNKPPSAAIVLPLNARGQLLGVMGLYRKHGSYDAADVFLAEEIGRRAALAMDNARLHDLVHAGVRARDDIIGIVSHDLRNPVNAVRMLSGVMLDREREEALAPDIAEYASVIRQAAEQMDTLIRDLLDVTRVEAGQLKVDTARENTEELLSDALRTLAPVAAEKSLTLRLNAPNDLPFVMADRERVAQAISNLVGNAVKFSLPGSEIIVRVAVLDGDLLFSVSDRGQGMTAEQLSHAFDRFWRSSRTDRQGAGLGLAITKGIIEAHGGRIWAESMPGAGSTFYFTLPIAA
ncbi:MAG: ATP-binding protein [Gemmatimonadaceae bacterium]|nr:ATP-binding protein [Gemmatimonadaceae bacterium]